VDILTILLLLCIAFLPSNVALRISLGLPLLLFFPGYVLVAALFANAKRLGNLERLALTFGLSLIIVTFIGLILNFTPWGIRLEPIIISISAFILVTSCIALIRDKELRLIKELRIAGWGHDSFENSVSVLLIAGIIGALIVLGYVVALPKVGEKFTDFYILGNTLKAESYPTDFVMSQGQVVSVSYDGGKTQTAADKGEVTIGIINHETQTASYRVEVQIDGKQTDIIYAGKSLTRLDQIGLQQDEKREQKIGFVPQNTGDNLKVEFLLFKNGDLTPLESLKLWINVK
jgi:uncharacterized membrane protein